MTKAQASHRRSSMKNRRSSMESLHGGDSHSSSMIPEVNDGTAMLRQFEEMTGTRHDYQERCPVLASASAISCDHLNATLEMGRCLRTLMDRYLTRPTPHVLKTGAAATLTACIQLTKRRTSSTCLTKRSRRVLSGCSRTVLSQTLKRSCTAKSGGLRS